MRIIKRGTEPKLLVFTCDNCGTVFEAESSEIKDGTNLMTCPVCGQTVAGYESEYEEDDEKHLTVDNFVFPEDFDQFGISPSSKMISDEEIICVIKEGVNFLRNHKDEYLWYWMTGDAWVEVLALDEEREYSVRVARGYYEMPLNYDEEDDEVRNL